MNQAHLKRISKDLYELVAPLHFPRFTVKAGFVTDGASIPRLFWTLVGPPIGGNYTEPAILHDALVLSGLYSPRECDRTMVEAMVLYRVRKRTINSIRLGLFISRAWRRQRPADHDSNMYLSRK